MSTKAMKQQSKLAELRWVKLTVAELTTLCRLVRREYDSATTSYSVKPLLEKLSEKLTEVL